MQSFTGLTDKIILFISCLLVYFFQIDVAADVAPILAAITISSFLSYFDDDRIKAGLICGFIFLAYFIPELIIFLPLIAFDMLFYRFQYMGLFMVIPLINFFYTVSAQTAFVVIPALSLSLWIRYRVENKIRLQAKYNELNLKTREMSIILKKQNSDLIEKQDNELNLATLNERNRIAREIHDNVGHLLSSAILQSGALLTINKDEKVKRSLETLNDTLTRAMNSIRASVHGLYDESIDLNAQALELIRQFTFCEVSYDYQINSNPPKKLKYAFILILKEALTNMMKHSNATQASVIFREHPALYQLIIRDNGNAKSYTMDNGLGLKNMKDRVESFNGNINILTENGFEIFISVPKEA